MLPSDIKSCIDASIQLASDHTVDVATNGTVTNGSVPALSQTGGC